ncbi:MAG: GNAT family N-acetyltransferase [Bryobacterales bacterium]|nr:GNAT family N-acetyltransferase [Bryobacterales bacterium]
MFPDGYTDLPPGKIAAAVTYLEITTIAYRPQPVAPVDLVLRADGHPEAAFYRELFRAVGSPWLWFSRLGLSDPELIAILHHPRGQLYVLELAGQPAGLLELDFRQPGEAELAYLGVVPECIGSGAGRFLMDYALFRVARHHAQEPLRRFWVHTCTLDHPSALGFYCNAGFVPYKRAIEVFDDPRLCGKLPPDCAPQVPIIRP